MARTLRLVLLLVVSLVATAAVAAAQSTQPTGEQRWRAIGDGRYAYTLYCAGCHGARGDGYGPAALREGTTMPDLRAIGHRTGEFDRNRVLEHIYATGQWSRDPMPAWGAVLRTGAGRSDGYALLAAHNLMAYVESLQGQPVEASSSPAAERAADPPRVQYAELKRLTTVDGASLYRAYCASCHGAAGRGDGPAVSGLASFVPDLTRIAERDGDCDVAHVRAHITEAGMHAAMPDWDSALASIYSEHRRQLIEQNLANQVRAMQVRVPAR